MTAEEIKAMMIDLEEEHEYVGLRFEERAYQVGDIVANSKSNMDRVDERDFPVYGTEEYDEMPELPGASSWSREARSLDTIDEYWIFEAHCYIVVGETGWFDDVDGEVLDDDEVVIEDATVAVVIK